MEKAERLYQKMLAKGFDTTTAANLGVCLIQRNEFGRAAYILKQAVESGGDIDAQNNYGVCLKKLGRTDEAIDYFESLEEKNAAILTNLGSCYLERGDIKLAEQRLAAAVINDPEHADAHWNLGLAQLAQRKWKGWENYDWGFKTKERKPRPYYQMWREWLGEDLSGKTILVWGEQGVGDEILFANCFDDIQKRAGKVVVDCHPRLAKVFERSFPKIDFYGTRKSDDWSWTDDYQIDFQTPMGTLPRYLRQKDKDFPTKGYLVPDSERVDYWRSRYPGIRVGLSWAGGSTKTSGEIRSFPLERLLSLLTGPKRDGVSFISLQYTPCYHEIAALASRYAVHLPHEEWALEDLTEQFNLIASCDLVISVITAAVHIAGAMDIPTWCLVPKGVSGAWKFTDGPDNIWHPSVRHFRQSKTYEWSDVICEVQKEFGPWLAQKQL